MIFFWSSPKYYLVSVVLNRFVLWSSHTKNSQPTIGFIGTSVGSSPFSTALYFWLSPYYGKYRGQNEKHHQIGMIRHSNLRFFCCAALYRNTNGRLQHKTACDCANARKAYQ
jgi:hypothetical protein